MPEIPGPGGPIAFERDAWGYPSVRARDRLDAAFAHGWLIATDRLVQVHLTRLAGEGRLLEALGDKPVFRALDRSMRTFDLSGDAEAEVGRMSPDTRALLDAWCDGFNARAAGRRRPLVLWALGEPVRPMSPAAMVVIYRMACFFGLTSLQLTGEVGITELLARGASPETVRLLLGDAAGGVQPDAIRGADLSTLGWFEIPAFGGSNAVAVAASRSSTGAALLWGQPHMEVARFPPVLYAIHFDIAGEGKLTGLNFPGLAWLSFGRTERVAWTYTYGHGDNVDILVEHCRDGRYETPRGWDPLVRREEVVKVRGGPDERWVFWDSPYGTILGDAATEGRYPCLRWTGLRRDKSDFDVFPLLERSRTAAGALEVHRELQALSLHALLADADGHIGYLQTGRVDQRSDGWDGAGPAVGWTRDHRDPAPIPERLRPVSLDPPEGIWVSANERVDGPEGTRWVTLPEPRWRKDRLLALLGGTERIHPDDLLRAMYDGHDLCAETLLAVWRPHFDDRGFQALCDWGGRADHPDRDRMLDVFHALHDELIRGLVEPHVGRAEADTFLDDLHLSLVFQWHLDKTLALEEPDLLDAAGLAALLRTAWPRALARAGAGEVPVRTRFVNAYFEGRLPKVLGFDGPEVTLPGGPVCPFQSRRTGFRGQAFVFGPAMNFCVDFSRPGAFYNLAGGASEQRFGPGYGRGVDAWLTGELRPIGGATGDPPRSRK